MWSKVISSTSDWALSTTSLAPDDAKKTSLVNRCCWNSNLTSDPDILIIISPSLCSILFFFLDCPSHSILLNHKVLAGFKSPPPRDVSSSSPTPSPPSLLRRVLLVGDFPLLHVVVSGVIHERRASEKRAGRRGGGGWGRETETDCSI